MSKNKILVVDDNVESLQIIIGILERFHPDFRLYQAVRGSSAIELAETTAINLIITDWDMPGISGIELIRGLKSNPKTQHIPVVIVTGIMLNPDDLNTALSEGAYDYLRKPIDPVELIARVNSALAFFACHEKEIEQKNIELAEKTLILIKDNEFNIQIINQLHKLMEVLDNLQEAKEHVSQILGHINQKVNSEGWKQFEIAFENVHAGFIKNLLSQYSDLTPAELRLSILIKLGLKTKDMASLLFQSPESIRVARSRLRKKLKIKSEQNFNSFLSSF